MTDPTGYDREPLERLIRASGRHEHVGEWCAPCVHAGRNEVLTALEAAASAAARPGPSGDADAALVTAVCDILWDHGIYAEDTVPTARAIVNRLRAAAPSSALDRDRLTEAMRLARQAVSWTPEAKDIAAEYDQLTAVVAPSDGAGGLDRE